MHRLIAFVVVLLFSALFGVVAFFTAGSTKSLGAGIQYIYFPNSNKNKIWRINDMTGAGLASFGIAGSGTNQFHGPSNICTGPDGKIYVADYGNNRIVRINDMTGAGWTTFGSAGSSSEQFNGPMAINFGPDGKLYIVDYGNSRIVRIDDMTGTGWTSIGTRGSGSGQFNIPTGISIGPDGKIYVADFSNHRLVRMNDMTGAGWTTFGSHGTGINQFGGTSSLAGPVGICFGADGRIYVGDAYNHRVVRINDMTGAGWTTYGTQGSGIGQFGGTQVGPFGVSYGPDGKIYLADYDNSRIVRMNDMTGAGWTTYTNTGLSHPFGVYAH